MSDSIPQLHENATLIGLEEAQEYLLKKMPTLADSQTSEIFLDSLFKDEVRMPFNMFVFLIDFLVKENLDTLNKLIESKALQPWIEHFVRQYYLRPNWQMRGGLENFDFPLESFSKITIATLQFYASIDDQLKADVFLFYLANFNGIKTPVGGGVMSQRTLNLDNLDHFFEQYHNFAKFFADIKCTDETFSKTFVRDFHDKVDESHPFDFIAATELLVRVPQSYRDALMLMLLNFNNFEEMMSWSVEELVLLSQLFDIQIYKRPFSELAYIRFDNNEIGRTQKCSNEDIERLHSLIQFTAKDSQNRLIFAQGIYGFMIDKTFTMKGIKKNWDNFLLFCEEFSASIDFNGLKNKIHSVAKTTQEISLAWFLFYQQLQVYCVFCRQKKLETLVKNKDQLMEIIAAFKQSEHAPVCHQHVPKSFTFEEMTLQAYQMHAIIERYETGGDEIKAEMLGCFLTEFDKIGILSEDSRPFVYALYLPSNTSSYFPGPYPLPAFTDPGIFLHEHSDVQFFLGSADVAKQRIQSAISQTLSSQYWQTELIKNAKEADATIVEIELYQENGRLTVVIRDNGNGMGLKEIIAFITPGNTSKNRTAIEANFGQGIFTALAKKEFTTLIVITYKDGCCRIFKLEKVGENIRIQIEEESASSRPNGTEIILQKEMDASPLNTAIQINSHLIQTCKFNDSMEVLLNGKPLAKPENPFTLRKSFIDRTGRRGELSLRFLRKEVGAVYVKGFKMGPIPEDHFSLVPRFLRDFYKKKQVSLALFLPSVEQVMGRSSIQADPTLEFAIHHLLLQGSLIFMIEEWKKGRRLGVFISSDIWDVTTSGGYQLIGDTPQLYQFAFGNDPQPLTLDKEEADDQEQMLTSVKDFLSQLPPENLPSIGVDGIMQQLHCQMQSADVSWHTQLIIQTLMVHYPFYPTGPSLYELFHIIQKGINEILNMKPLHELSKRERKDAVEKIDHLFDSLIDKFPSLSLIVEKFKTTLSKRMSAITQQSKQKRHAPSFVLANFFKRLAKETFGQDIEVEFHSTPGGDAAYAHQMNAKIFFNQGELEDSGPINQVYTQQVSSKISINLLQDELEKFERLVSDYKSGVPQEQLMKQYASVLSYWIKIFAHEMAHIQLGTGCATTHDTKFDKQAASIMEKLFEHPSHISTLANLVRSFEETEKLEGERLDSERTGRKRKKRKL